MSRSWGSGSLLRVVLFSLFGVLSFLLCYFLASQRMNINDNSLHCTETQTQSALVRSVSNALRETVRARKCAKRGPTTHSIEKRRSRPHNGHNNEQKTTADIFFSLQVLQNKHINANNNGNSNSKRNSRDEDEQRGKQPPSLESVFWQYHHPSSPLASEVLMRARTLSEHTHSTHNPHSAHNTHSTQDTPRDELLSPYEGCERVYLTRTGSLANMPNKCLSVAWLDERHIAVRFPPLDPRDKNTNIKDKGESLQFIPHYRRLGKVAGNVDQYAKDFLNAGALKTEKTLMPGLLGDVDALARQFVQVMGAPPVISRAADGTEKRRTVIVMVLNEGVLDLFLNFLCSLHSSPALAQIPSSIVAFVGQKSLLPVLQSLSIKAFYSPSLGPIPAKAAAAYGDLTFAMLMWLKATAVYVAYHAGYNVLFQDADLVWFEDPLPLLESFQDDDVVFMDDGASAWLMEKMLKSLGEIAVTHSHQSVLTRYTHEALDAVGLRFNILKKKEFPTGYLYHHDKQYIEALKSFSERPKVFHMCWTESRVQKVEYFSNIGMWYLPAEDEQTCATSSSLQNLAATIGLQRTMKRCCARGDYWKQRQAFEEKMMKEKEKGQTNR